MNLNSVFHDLVLLRKGASGKILSIGISYIQQTLSKVLARIALLNLWREQEETAPGSFLDGPECVGSFAMEEENSEIIDQSAPPESRSELHVVSFVRRPSSRQSLSERSLGISMESRRSSTQVGLRGDMALYDDLKEFVKME
jgi:hypothetical protein